MELKKDEIEALILLCYNQIALQDYYYKQNRKFLRKNKITKDGILETKNKLIELLTKLEKILEGS